jgi:tight adherence protein C
MAVILAIYAAVTVRDPMAKRVKALNARREELKAGIVTGKRKKRQSLVRDRDHRQGEGHLEGMKVLQESQVKIIQQKLAQAGYPQQGTGRRRHLGAHGPADRAGLIGVVVFYWSTCSPTGAASSASWASRPWWWRLQGAGNLPQEQVTKRTDAIRKGLPDALDLLVICAEAGLTVDAAFNRVAKELGRAYPELGDEFALTAIELSFLTERARPSRTSPTASISMP